MKKIKEINQGDLLTFLAGDNRYKSLLCTSTYTEESPYYYTFAALTYDSPEKPTEEQLRETEFFGIANTNDLPGSYGLTIWRKDFMKFRDNFELIGNLSIVDNLDKNGNGSMNASDWNFLNEFFSEQYKTILKDRGQQKLQVKSILRS